MSLLLSLAQNVVNRVASLPFISSAYNLVSSAYSYTRGIHPYISNVCSMAETVAAMAVGSAVGGVQPILSHLEPQIASVNEYACKGLDKLEESLPFLQQPTEKVKAASGAKDIVTNRVTKAVDLTRGTVQDMDLTRGTVQDSVELTKSVVEAVQDGKEMTTGQLVASGVDAVLEKSGALVDHYLPMANEELGEKVLSHSTVQQNYFVRLGSLSNKVRHQAYQHSLNKLQLAKQNIQDTLSQLQLIEYLKQGVGHKLQDRLEKLQQLWIEWSQTQQRGSPAKGVEPHTLAMVRTITQQLHSAYVNLVSSIQGLPSNIQETVQQAVNKVQQLHASFSTADSFQDLSSSSLTQSREKVTTAQESLDALLEYVTHNIPLNWLVGPFTPSVRATQEATEDPSRNEVLSLNLWRNGNMVFKINLTGFQTTRTVCSMSLSLLAYLNLKVEHF
uniref:Perilipin n=1 Tax=Gopherus evgoodei TaxID=1825980 RepID=A0A8C4W116_9SAUR